MRVGIFTEVYEPYVSGVVTSVKMLKKSLESLGVEVFLVTINMDKMKYEYDEKEHILRVPGIESGIYDNFMVSSIYPVKCVNRIKKWKLDIIHTHTEGSMGTFGRLLAKQLNIPVVHTYHTMYEDYIYLLTKGYFDKPVKKVLEYVTMFYCDKTVSELIVPTKKTYDLFKKKYGMEREVNIIPTGIDIERFDKKRYDKQELINLRNKLGIKDNDFVLLLVSRISEEQKNIKFLIDCQKLINKKYKNIKLLIIGDGPDLEYFKKISKDNNSIIFTGMVPWNEVSKYYQLGNVFVTSSKTETQGLTVIEGMAASLPIICIEDDSFKIAVIDGYNGLFFNNKKEYINNVYTLYNDRNKYLNMSKQALNSSKQFSVKFYGERILEVYKRAIKNNKKDIIYKFKHIFYKNKNV